MTSWIQNRLIAKGNSGRIRGFLQVIKGQQQPLDFDQIIPVPESIRQATLACSPERRWDEQDSVDSFYLRPFTDEEKKELELVGFRSWQDWSIAHWSTTRNAFEVEIDDSTVDFGYVVISFETEQSPPLQILSTSTICFRTLLLLASGGVLT